MTNAEIISTACMLEGITETVHTFVGWKERGYSVKKGERAALSLRIWKHQSRKNKVGEEESHMFMTTAHFFKESQVKKI